MNNITTSNTVIQNGLNNAYALQDNIAVGYLRFLHLDKGCKISFPLSWLSLTD